MFAVVVCAASSWVLFVSAGGITRLQSRGWCGKCVDALSHNAVPPGSLVVTEVLSRPWCCKPHAAWRMRADDLEQVVPARLAWPCVSTIAQEQGCQGCGEGFVVDIRIQLSSCSSSSCVSIRRFFRRHVLIPLPIFQYACRLIHKYLTLAGNMMFHSGQELNNFFASCRS